MKQAGKKKKKDGAALGRRIKVALFGVRKRVMSWHNIKISHRKLDGLQKRWIEERKKTDS